MHFLAGFGGHTFQHGLHLRQLLLQHFHKFVEILGRVGAEHLAPLVHKAVKVGLAALHFVAHHLVEIAHHFAGGGHIVGGHILDGLLHLLGDVLRHLAFEQIQQFLKLALGVGVDEVVLHQFFQLTAYAFGQVVQLFQVAVGPLLQQVVEGLLLGAFRFGGGVGLLAGVVQAVLDALPFGVDDVVQALFQVVQHRVHIVLLHLLAAAVFELFHKLAQAGGLLAVAVGHTLTEQVAEGLQNVAVLHDVVGQQVH